jgi:carbon monoxide dehydrogenase subunit G
MPLVERSTTIAVPPERAFGFVADASNALRWMHNFTRFEPEGPDAYGLGARVRATGMVLGFPVATTLEIVEFDPPRRLVSRTTGRLRSHSTWEFAPAEGGTRVTFTGEYDVPGGLLRLIGGPLVQRELETNAEISLRNLKAALEGAV